jgi:hypothetical protein
MANDRLVIHVRLDRELKEAVKKVARLELRSINSFAAHALRDYCSRAKSAANRKHQEEVLANLEF